MRKSTYLPLLAPLLKKPYFTAKDAKTLGIHSSLLHHYVKKGILKRISRGLYRSSTYQSQEFRWEDLIEAVYSVPGGVICLISALAIYDLTEEMPRQFWIAVKNGTSMKRPKEYKIIRLRNMHIGKTTLELEGVSVPIFDRERTILDAFRLLSPEIAIKALKKALSPSKQRLDLIKLQKYAKVLRVSIHPYLLTATT